MIEACRILLLDDEPLILMDLEFAAEDQDCQPLTATNVREAMEHIEAQGFGQPSQFILVSQFLAHPVGDSHATIIFIRSRGHKVDPKLGRPIRIDTLSWCDSGHLGLEYPCWVKRKAGFLNNCHF